MLDKLPIAMEFQLIDDGHVFALRSDFDAAYEPLSPGSYLSRHMLVHLFGRGLRRYLMGPGENVYKYRWADGAEPVSTMTIYGRSIRGRLIATRELVVKPAVRRIRDDLRASWPWAPFRAGDVESGRRTMSGICGWYGATGGDPRTVVDAMRGACSWREGTGASPVFGARFALASVGPPGTTMVVTSGPIHIAVQGHPHWVSGNAAVHTPDALLDFCRRAIDAYLQDDSQFLAETGGDFSLALVDERTGRVTLAIDRIGVRNVVYEHAGDTLIFGATSDVVRSHPLASGSIAPQALYDYVYFHMIPGPATVYRQHARLRAGHALTFAENRAITRRYWQPRFSEPARATVDEFKPAFRAALDAGVASVSGGAKCGAFLSGGTDSSTIAGLLGAVSGVAARTYSIGFAAAGYDEMEYARITARHFGTDHHEYYVTPDDVVAAVPLIASAYDQPFGNASAIPTYYCARLAQADGVTRMLGGDGGDELFGGNTRYAKQYQLALYQRIPAALRRDAGTRAAGHARHGDRCRSLRKLHSYVDTGAAADAGPIRHATTCFDASARKTSSTGSSWPRSIPACRLPCSATTYARRAGAKPDQPHARAGPQVHAGRQRSAEGYAHLRYRRASTSPFRCCTNRWSTCPPRCRPRSRFAAASCAIFSRKRCAISCRRRPSRRKSTASACPPVCGCATTRRCASSAATRWQSLRQRHIFRNELLDDLMSTRLSEHAAYYGTLAWVLMMLEMWFQAHVDAASPVRGAARAAERGAAF